VVLLRDATDALEVLRCAQLAAAFHGGVGVPGRAHRRRFGRWGDEGAARRAASREARGRPGRDRPGTLADLH
jgi:hypothetical protein